MSVKLNIYNQNGEAKSEVKLSKDIFDVEMNPDLVHQVAVAQMGNERQVLAHTKGRAEVRGGGKKPWKQKGTGRARAGSSRSPIWIGGGVTFGPTKDRNFSKKINKKMRRKAMFMVLTEKVTSKNLVILEKLEITEFKTKVFDTIFKNLENKVLPKKEIVKEAKENTSANSAQEKIEEDKKERKKKISKKQKRSILFVNMATDDKTKKSSANLEGVKSINLNNINILDLLKFRNIIITDEAVGKIEDIYKK